MQTYFCSRLTSPSRNTKIRAEIMRIPSNLTQDNLFDQSVIRRSEPSLAESDSSAIQNRCVVTDLAGFYTEIFMGSRSQNFHNLKDTNPSRFLIFYYDHELLEHKSISVEATNRCSRDSGQTAFLVHSLIAVLRIETTGFHSFAERSPVIKSLEHPLDRCFQRAQKQSRTRKFEREEYRKRWLAASEPEARTELAKLYGISDLEGLKIVGDTWANPVPLAAIFERLEFLVETELPCRVEIVNSARGQVHTGQLMQMDLKNAELKLAGEDWDSSTTLSEIESAWLVSNRASGRMEYSIELFNRVGRMMIRFSGTPDLLENAVWQDLLGTLPTLS